MLRYVLKALPAPVAWQTLMATFLLMVAYALIVSLIEVRNTYSKTLRKNSSYSD